MAEYEKLESKLGDPSYWMTCDGCICKAEDFLDCTIKITTWDEVSEHHQRLCSQALAESFTGEILDLINRGMKCPNCGKSLEIAVSTQTKNDEGWKTPLKSIVFSCPSHDFSMEQSSKRDKKIGYICVGTILNNDAKNMWVEVCSEIYADSLQRLVPDRKILFRHSFDKKMLGALKKTSELVEIVVVGNNAIKINI